MGKYEPLAQWLAASDGEVVSMTFEEIEAVLGSPLPKSGKTYQAFWSNPTAALPLVRSGFRARPKLADGRIEFIRIAGKGAATKTARPESTPITDTKPDVVLVGCVKTKLPGRHKAQDIYRSTLFLGRRSYAESKAVPWFILSAKHGLLGPDDEIDSYDVALADLTPSERSKWGSRVLSAIDQRIGPVNGKTIEVHAGAEYRDYGLRRGLEVRGATVVVPLEGVDFGNQLAWYQASAGAHADQRPKAQPAISEDARLLTKALTREFFEGALDLSLRPDAPIPGWAAMPECVAAAQLLENGATPVDVRIFLTLVAAMDRARDAERLWASATRLFLSTPWVYQPEKALLRPLFELRDALAVGGVSQRHGADSAAWRLILEAIASDQSPSAFRRAIFDGTGDAAEILRSVVATRSSGQTWFPFLSGPKVSVMWCRMLADPGGAKIENIGILPVAVDVQVRKVSEYLGITQTEGRDLDAVRNEIQRTWSALADSVIGSPALAGTCAALDPALWFFGRWGCTFCERGRRRMPISTACGACRFSVD